MSDLDRVFDLQDDLEICKKAYAKAAERAESAGIAERDRIVAIIVAEIAGHVTEQKKYKDGEANREAWDMEESAIYALQDVLTKVLAG